MSTKKLGELQEDFSLAKAKLFLYAGTLGFGVREKSGPRCVNCHEGKANSVHKDGLATDIRLTINSELVDQDVNYNVLHDKWDTLGGAPRIVGDLGHFSFKYRGRW